MRLWLVRSRKRACRYWRSRFARLGTIRRRNNAFDRLTSFRGISQFNSFTNSIIARLCQALNKVPFTWNTSKIEYFWKQQKWLIKRFLIQETANQAHFNWSLADQLNGKIQKLISCLRWHNKSVQIASIRFVYATAISDKGMKFALWHRIWIST